MGRIAVVTDSTAYLPPEVAAEAALEIVPLVVTLDGRDGLEGVDITPADVAAALIGRRVAVTTSRPAPAEFAAAYRSQLDAGASGVVSAHISAKLSGTYDAAVMAAAEFGGAVEVVDSRSTGMGLGFAALAAADAARAGADLFTVRDAADACVGRTTALFYVDNLEYLRRGGRIGAASALLGTALSVKPILHVVDGGIVVRDKVRTASRALARMIDLAVEAAGDEPVDVAVHHLAGRERADEVLEALRARMGEALRRSFVTEIGAAVAAHAGPGLVSVIVRRL